MIVNKNNEKKVTEINQFTEDNLIKTYRFRDLDKEDITEIFKILYQHILNSIKSWSYEINSKIIWHTNTS